MIKTVDSCIKKTYKTHHRTSSMEMNTEKLKPTTKNISQMKEMLYNDKRDENAATSSHQSIVLNQTGMPCFNNINIYTTSSNPKNEVNLRQFIFNKATKQKQYQQPIKGHKRSISNL
jgi:pyruvate formate-lyase activating enzyme-like uncharacterized protein